MPEPWEVERILESEGIQTFERDLRSFSLSELKESFGAESSGRIILAKVIKNVVWQAVTWIRQDRFDGVNGNLRSFYYQWIKPVMARIPGALEQARDPYNTMLDVFVEMVGKYRLFRYGDLDLDDANWEHRLLGGREPHLIVLAEKVGFFRFLKRVHQDLGVTVVATGGTPSLLSTEYLLASLKEVTEGSSPLVVFGIVDWDPSGWMIARSQLRQMKSLGLEEIEYHDLIHPDFYRGEEIEMFKYPLPKRQKTKNRKWLTATGGLSGELYGLEADSLPRERLREVLDEKISPYLSS